MSFKVHLIHDLYYGFNEPTEPADLALPDVDLVIFNGNLAHHGKRSIYYAYQLCAMYPDIQFVYNDGYKERYQTVVDKWKDEYENSMTIRSSHGDWPKNLHWRDPRTDEGLNILLRTGQTVSVWTCFGFPNIKSYDGDWEDTWFYCNIGLESTPVYKLESDIHPGTDLKLFGDLTTWASPEWVHQRFIEQENKIRNWETGLEHYGILVTHLNPYKDDRLNGIKYSGYNIHLANRLWATTQLDQNVNYVGAMLRSNPGRGSIARGKVLEVDIV